MSDEPIIKSVNGLQFSIMGPEEIRSSSVVEVTKNDTYDKDVPVIMISGHATVKIAIEAIKIGAYEFIEKPFSREKILIYVK